MGDVIADPSGSWTPSTAEAYIDQQIATVTGNLASETLARQAADTGLQNQISTKADKVSGATNGNFAGLDANGNIKDSGKNENSFLTQHQSIKTINSASIVGTGNVNLQTPLTFDTTPTANSNNPVTSGGIKVYVDNKTDAQDTVIANAIAAQDDEIDRRMDLQDAEIDSRMDQQDAIISTLNGQDVIVVSSVPASGVANKIYRVYGTTSYTDYMFNAGALTTPIKIATYQMPGIDSEPTPDSTNLVTSGGVESRLNKGLCFDVNRYIDLADYEYELGTIDATTGQDSPQTLSRRVVGYIPIEKLTYYYFIVKGTINTISPADCNIFFYDENKDFIGVSYSSRNAENTIQRNASYFRFTTSINNSVTTIETWCLVDRLSYNKIVARNSFYVKGINSANRFAEDANFNPKDCKKIVNLSILRRSGLLTFKSKNICNPANALRGGSVEYDGLITRETNWETSSNYLQVLDCIDPNTQYTIKNTYAPFLYWYDENDNYIGREVGSSTTYTTISPANAYILRFQSPASSKATVCLGSTLFNVDYEDGYVVKQELLPGNASGNYDFSNYVYEAIGDSRTAGYNMNTIYNNNGEISSWPASPVQGYYQITQDGTYNGIEAKAGDGIYYNGSTCELIKGGYSYINDNGKVCVWPAGGTYPQVIGEKTGMIVYNHAYAGAAFCERTWMSDYTPHTGYNQALQISPATNIVTIFLGVNDVVAGADAPVANMCQRDNENDIYDVQTFKGAIRQTIKNIRLIAPMAMIIFINEDDGSTGYDGGSSKAQMIEEVADEYRFPVLNLCHCGVDPRQDIPYLDTKYQSRTDSLHESTVGQDFLARVVGGEIKKYLW